MNTNNADKELQELESLIEQVRKAQIDTMKELKALNATLRILEDIENANDTEV